MTAPILKYFGAKWSIADQIVSLLPRTRRYVEPFCGSAAIYLNLPWQPYHAVLNDLNDDIVNLFRVLREQPNRLIEQIELTPWAETEHQLSWTPAEGIDDVERARRFLTRQWMNHGGVLHRAGFRHRGNTSSKTSTTSVWNALPKRLQGVVDRLKLAEIRCRPALEIISYYNAPNTLLFVDPPYPRSTRGGRTRYTHEITDGDHIELIKTLDRHTGAVVLCGYDCNLYNSRLGHWRRVQIAANADGGRARTEVVWLKNVPVQQAQLFDMEGV